MKQWIKNLFTAPGRRARAFRKNDQAQVMVLTAVMIFVIMIFAINNLNTASGIYNRMRTQNAVDAAADAYAVWQSRGLNVAQHINNVHWVGNMIFFVGQTANCIVRVIVCPALNAIPIVGPGLSQACCAATLVIFTGIEYGQALLQQGTHTMQEGLNIVIPFLGWISANTLAEANGADPIGGAVADKIDDLLAGIGLGETVGGILGQIGSALSNVPIYALPLDFTQFKIPFVGGDGLNIKIKGGADNVTENGTPMHPPWYFPPLLGEICKQGGCQTAGQCAGDSADPDSPAAIIIAEDQCGWEDSYFYGFPGYNTWITGKRAINIIGSYEKLPWLNPDRDGDALAQQSRALYHKTFDQVSGEFRNPAFLAIASSQPFGHRDTDKQPVVERSIGVSGFQFMKPQLISVHIGPDDPSDSVTSALFIWH